MKQTIKKLKHIFLALAVASSFSLVFVAPAASAASLFSGAKKEACAGVQLSGPPAAADCSAADQQNLTTTIQSVIGLMSIVIGIIAVIMIIIGGFRFIVSNGDSGKITSARNTIIYALVGLILAALAQVIVRFVLGNV
jgi:uncharacterized membrane protein